MTPEPEGMKPYHRISSVFVVFCVHIYGFADLIRRAPPPTFSDTDRHFDTTFFQLNTHYVQISWSVGSEKNVETCAAAGGRRVLDFLRKRQTPYQPGKALRSPLKRNGTHRNLSTKYERHFVFCQVLHNCALKQSK